jgi:hypothetical protein
MRRAARLHDDDAGLLLLEERDQVVPLQLALHLQLSGLVNGVTWKTDLAVSRPIMVIPIAGGSLSTGSDNPYCGTPMP